MMLKKHKPWSWIAFRCLTDYSRPRWQSGEGTENKDTIIFFFFLLHLWGLNIKHKGQKIIIPVTLP